MYGLKATGIGTADDMFTGKVIGRAQDKDVPGLKVIGTTASAATIGKKATGIDTSINKLQPVCLTRTGCNFYSST